jgi:hypothetical protein
MYHYATSSDRACEDNCIAVDAWKIPVYVRAIDQPAFAMRVEGPRGEDGAKSDVSVCRSSYITESMAEG